MLILGMKPGHDGSLAVIDDERLLLSLEGEKDSYLRHECVTPTTFIDIARMVDRPPDVVALSGWTKTYSSYQHFTIGAGYLGTEPPICHTSRFFGAATRVVSSSHERSHIMTAVGMAKDEGQEWEAVLVWEGGIGTFYLVDRDVKILKTIPVLHAPGGRYAFLYGLAHPWVPDSGSDAGWDSAGKLMALASYGDASDADSAIEETVERILAFDASQRLPKKEFKNTPLYNVGVESPATKIAAALLTERLFDTFAQAAERSLPAGIPLRISGGCGLNCQWNESWRRHGFFSSVFVPPCTNDSGSAIGTAIDALRAITGRHRITWDVYCGPAFDNDIDPCTVTWERTPLQVDRLAAVLRDREIVAWVQGKCEMGPRALGNRSLLAEPFCDATRDRLNVIKRREGYRPVAPCCRLEDVGQFFDSDFADPYMLYTRMVRSPDLRAITHVDGSARLQTVTESSNRPLYRLLSAFARETGSGVLCNTSLNYKGRGFINRMSDLTAFCDLKGINHMVVDSTWFSRRQCAAIV
jgi:hydroxymethyl cephem carbamoyltransferase